MLLLMESLQNHKRVLVLNDQWGAVLAVTEDVTNTLRAQDHGHPPIVLVYDTRGNGGVKRVRQ